MDEYEILEGVRRAKAASLCGHTTINARVDEDGALSAEFDVEITKLRSRFKDSIDISIKPKLDRWLNVLRATQAGKTLPPITVRRGNAGVRIRDVDFQY